MTTTIAGEDLVALSHKVINKSCRIAPLISALYMTNSADYERADNIDDSQVLES